MGYDISDYEDVMADFGTMDDLLELIELLHQHDIKLVMDLVVNHTSDEHAWFVEAKKSKDNPYRDYYIWRDNSDHRPPNNWSSFFTPSAWNLDDVTNSWYLHLFSPKQPDLNWEHKPLRDDIYQMINRWFDLGIDGFRMDVITLIAKKEGLPDGKHFINEQGYFIFLIASFGFGFHITEQFSTGYYPLYVSMALPYDAPNIFRNIFLIGGIFYIIYIMVSYMSLKFRNILPLVGILLIASAVLIHFDLLNMSNTGYYGVIPYTNIVFWVLGLIVLKIFSSKKIKSNLEK